MEVLIAKLRMIQHNIWRNDLGFFSYLNLIELK